jgi:guanylate kinase
MGLSGSGKTTIEKALEGHGFKRSISYTTREPQVRNGVLEQDNNEYKFVTKERFMALVKANAIIEYENYNGNYYGTPEPIGADRHVAVVCLKGFKALKEKYGDQVIGVYIKCDFDLSLERTAKRHSKDTVEQIQKRLDTDTEFAKQMEECADLTISASCDLTDNIAKILSYAKERRMADRTKSKEAEDLC